MFGGLFGGGKKAAPARRAPVPARRPAAAAPATSGGITGSTGGGGGMFGSIASTMIQGAAFGAGSSVAHRAVDGMMGPREMTVKHDGGEASGAGAGSAAGASAGAAASSAPAAMDCTSYQADFNQCMGDNPGQISMCQPYADMLSSCARGETM